MKQTTVSLFPSPKGIYICYLPLTFTTSRRDFTSKNTFAGIVWVSHVKCVQESGLTLAFDLQPICRHLKPRSDDQQLCTRGKVINTWEPHLIQV